MRKRDKKRENKDILNALAMITQIGLSMMTCMVVSFAIGYYLDRWLGTKFWVMILLLVGILAAIKSLFILTGRLCQTTSETGGDEGGSDERSKEDTP